MSERRILHVTPRDDGKWAVKGEGAKRASSIHDTQKQAIDRATEQAKNTALGQVKIHGEDGRIREERTYGKDPYPPPG